MDPFNMVIVGKTACGKTKYLLDILEEKYKGKIRVHLPSLSYV